MKSSKSIKSRQILLSGLVALVLVAGYYRWTVDSGTTVSVSGDGVPKSEQSQTEGKKTEKIKTDEKTEEKVKVDEKENQMGYFEKSRYEREVMRSSALAMAENSDSKEMDKKISEEMEKSEKETIIESLVKSKGFEDCVVFLDGSGASVVVKCEKLDFESANIIKDIVISKTNCKASDIRISSKKE